MGSQTGHSDLVGVIVQAVGRYALDHFVPVILVGTLAERHAPSDAFGGIGYID